MICMMHNIEVNGTDMVSEQSSIELKKKKKPMITCIFEFKC